MVTKKKRTNTEWHSCDRHAHYSNKFYPVRRIRTISTVFQFISSPKSNLVLPLFLCFGRKFVVKISRINFNDTDQWEPRNSMRVGKYCFERKTRRQYKCSYEVEREKWKNPISISRVCCFYSVSPSSICIYINSYIDRIVVSMLDDWKRVPFTRIGLDIVVRYTFLVRVRVRTYRGRPNAAIFEKRCIREVRACMHSCQNSASIWKLSKRDENLSEFSSYKMKIKENQISDEILKNKEHDFYFFKFSTFYSRIL